MKDRSSNSRRPARDEFEKKIEQKEQRKLKGRRERSHNIWFGLGMFGLVGWSVAIPTLLGIAVGIWLDSTLRDRYSWTLMFLIIGLAIGCLNAWFWLKKEGRPGK